MRTLLSLIVLSFASTLLAQSPILLYTSVDEPVVRPIVSRFEKETGLKVKVVTDGEATKTAGLAAKLEAEKTNPRCDVYWGNEVAHTLNLAAQGVFAPYVSSVAADIPQRWRGRDDLFTCVALRARWIVISTRPEAREAVARVKTLADLADPALKGKVGFCHPAFGTAAGHVAALYTRMGQPRFTAFMQSLQANELKVVGGNAAVVREVAAGTLLAGVTDNDDVQNAIAQGMKVSGFSLEGDDALVIPTTLALVKGAPNPDAGKRLIDFLLNPAVEKEMLAARYAAFSVRDPKLADIPADYEAAARNLRTAVETSLQLLQKR